MNKCSINDKSLKLIQSRVAIIFREYLKENGLEGQDGSLNCEFAHLEPQGESLRIR